MLHPDEETVLSHKNQDLPIDARTEELDARILLIEDGMDNQRLIAAILRKAGATVETSDDGRMGLRKALTAHAMAEDRQQCLESGCDEYLAKSINRQKLLSKLGQYTTQPRLRI